jgi:hypothetical protein
MRKAIKPIEDARRDQADRATEERHAAERERARKLGFLEVAKEEAQDNADTLILLSKH